MRILVGLLALFVMGTWAAAAPARIKKVLPHYIDHQGRHSLSPSLYERDAYQERLRKNPLEQGGIRFDVHWKAAPSSILTLRAELRGTHNDLPSSTAITKAVVAPRAGYRWTALQLDGAEYQKFGRLIAWRVTVWDGDRLVTEQRSFLW